MVESYLNYMQEVVAKYNLQSEDILRRMNLNKNSPAQTIHSLKDKLKALDPTIDDTKAQKAAQEILRGAERIEVTDLVRALGSNLGTYIS